MSRVLSQKTESLECHLTAEEFTDRARQLAEACQNVGREEGRQSQIKADMKAAMAALEAERSRLSLVVSRKAEMRDVRTRTEADDVKIEAVTIREDTGEIIKRRTLEFHERQPLLPGTEPPTCDHGVDIADDCRECEAAIAKLDAKKRR